MKPFSIYLHIPYCTHRCPYCDFNVVAGSTFPEREYVEALLSELDRRATQSAWQKRPVRSIFFGGGTPSLFQPRSFASIIIAIADRFPILDDVEVTIEANPGTVTSASFEGLRAAGVNRVSFGAQSFDATTLRTLGRVHDAEQTVSAIQSARAAGIRNTSLDLLYGVPGQTLIDFQRDVRTALALTPQHLSAYSLTIEKGTDFYTKVHRKILRMPAEGVVCDMMTYLFDTLPANGFAHYEISNFAQSGYEARHNLAYWDGADYLGLGAGAHSYVQGMPTIASEPFGRRWANVAPPPTYIERAAASGEAIGWSEDLAAHDAMFEYFFVGLRKLAGVSSTEFRERFGLSLDDVYPGVVPILVQEGLLKRADDTIALTRQGVFLADSVIENFADPRVEVAQA